MSSVHNLAPTLTVDKPEVGLVALDSALQEQERIITMSYALASEASLKSKLVTGWSFIQFGILLVCFIKTVKIIIPTEILTDIITGGKTFSADRFLKFLLASN